MSFPINTVSQQMTIISFLRSIGLDVAEKNQPGFRMNIEAGRLFVGPGVEGAMILQAAAKLALLPKSLRPLYNGDIDQTIDDGFMALEAMNVSGGAPIYQVMVNISETSAIAWRWAAGRHLGFSPEEVILDSEFDGAAQEIRTLLTLKQYCGCRSLIASGFCTQSGYPKLDHWVQPIDLPTKKREGDKSRLLYIVK